MRSRQEIVLQDLTDAIEMAKHLIMVRANYLRVCRAVVMDPAGTDVLLAIDSNYFYTHQKATSCLAELAPPPGRDGAGCTRGFGYGPIEVAP